MIWLSIPHVKIACVDILPCSMSKITQQEINCEFSFSSLTLSIFTLQPPKAINTLDLRFWVFAPWAPPTSTLLYKKLCLLS